MGDPEIASCPQRCHTIGAKWGWCLVCITVIFPSLRGHVPNMQRMYLFVPTVPVRP